MKESDVSGESLLSADELISATGGKYIGSAENKNLFCFTSVATDSRNVICGTMFVPLIGENQDGHLYCPQAVENGARILLIALSEYEKNGGFYDKLVADNAEISVVAVKNTLKALQDAAAAYVAKFPTLVKIAVTGSSGKTTSKEMIVSVLRQKYSVVYTQGNFNSETGLPLSVFNIRKNHEIGVFEMGMNRKNEIKEISGVLKANFALITNIGTAHIGILGSRQNIAEEKRHAFDYITENGAAFIPAIDEFAGYLAENVKGDVIQFGSLVPPETSGIRYVRDCGIGGTDFSVDGVEIHLGLPGVYNYANALGAVAVGKRLGVSAEFIKKGLESLSPIAGRMETEKLTLKNGRNITLIKDCYNANPDSMQNVLAFCKSLSGGRLLYVLGDMLELGEKSAESHEAIGCIVASDKPALAVFVGAEMEYAYKKACVRGFIDAVYSKKSDENAISYIASVIIDKAVENDVLLIKASRGIALERLIPELTGEKGK